MPGVIGNGVSTTKRKRVNSSNRPSKRAKSESSDEGSDAPEDRQAQLLLLESEIVDYHKYGKIKTLLDILRTDGDEDAIIAAISLFRIFAKLMASGDLSSKPGENEELKERYADYKSVLVALLGQEEASATAFTLCMRLLKVEGENLRQKQDHSFPAELLKSIVRVLITSEIDVARKEFIEKFADEYDDVRFYTLKAIETILSEEHSSITGALVFPNTLELLSAVETVPETSEELEDFYLPAPKKTKHDLYSLTKHKGRAQGAWLALMRQDMDKDQRKALLSIMSNTIAPWFTKPELLMDFLTDSYNAGGSTSLLSLSGVFYLIQERNLDYPSFYRKLYSLLDSEILHSKHRSRFLRLMDTFLASTHLPAVLIASFIKRLSRLMLNAPPSGIVAVVPWIYNILKKHPSCTFMIHREIRGADAKAVIEKEGLMDPFLMDEEDPMETNAIESSLWEVVALQSHFHPNVATLANIISEQFTKQSYNLEDFLDHSYGSMVEAELGKEVKKIPVIEPMIPKKIFTEHEITSDLENSLLVKIFEFK